MKVHVARQPIFDAKMQVFAYELLYRSIEGVNDDKDGNHKTSEVVFNTLVTLGLDTMLNGCRAFINFTKDTIQDNMPSMFSNEVLVVEILEDIVPDDHFITQCKALKEAGYLLALDDFISSYEHDLIIDLVDIIKVDFMLTSEKERAEIKEKYKHRNVRFLAEKVETKAEFDEAVDLGYHYFQGFFFSKPVLVSGNDYRVFNDTFIYLLTELNQSEPSYSKLEEIVSRDFSLTYKLLKLVNSAAFYSRNQITSIRHALTLLGFKEMRKWFSLLMVREAGAKQPRELTRTSLVRGKMFESLLINSSYRKLASEGFLIGMLSLADIILDRKMEEIIADLPVEEPIKMALRREPSMFTRYLSVIEAYERGDFDAISSSDLDESMVSTAYINALDWVNKIELHG